MALRKAAAYSKTKDRPYTRRSRKKSKSYIKTIPQHKIVKFRMGNLKAFRDGKYKFVLKLKSKEFVQVRDNALEACRQAVHRYLDKEIPGVYYFEVKKFPHQIIRENRVFSGGSKGERVNTGMKQSFGTAIGRSAFINPGDDVFIIAIGEEKFIPLVRSVIDKVRPKLPCKTKVITIKN